MNCPKCGTANPEGHAFCSKCGAQLPVQQPQQPQQQNVFTTPTQPAAPRKIQIPAEYKPIGAWGYVGYGILFGIPLVGFILMLVFAFGGAKNINLRNYARGALLSLLLGIIILVIIAVIATAVGVDWQEIIQQYSNTYTY